MKTKTRDQVVKMQEKAVRFSRDVLNDSDKADEIAGLSVEEYADRKKITIENPRRRHAMAHKSNQVSRQQLLDQIDDLQAENQDLNDRLDEITDLAAPPQDEDEYEDDQD